MKRIFIISLLACAVLISYNCSKNKPLPTPAKVQLELPEIPYSYNTSQTPSGLKSNLYEDMTLINNNKATIGRVLFYDKALSINNTVACANCHLQKAAFADVSTFSTGFDEKKTGRNSMAISNLFEERNIGYFWDLRETKIESMVLKPIENHIEMGFNRVELIAEKISNLDYYQELFSKYYGDNTISSKRVQECLASFVFSIVSNNSKFDKGLTNNFKDFNPSELRGKALFTNNNCQNCHLISSSFSSGYGASNKSGNIGLDASDIDKGSNGAYKIPRLKNIALTAPYMHDGRFATLEDVLDHYSEKIQNNPNLSSILRVSGNPRKFNFSEQDKQDLIAFLNTLTDETVLTDPKFSSPFR
jgi:cytochrome c peroxidase